MQLDEIRAFAQVRHAGQTDKQGRDYYDAHLRPIAESLAPLGADAEAAGWLHDVIEDTPATAEELLGRGVPEAVVAAVVSVTKVDGERYPDLITRSVADPLGRLVKLADNAWNVLSSAGLAATDPGKAADLLTTKYLPARERLLDACGWTPQSPEVAGVEEVLMGHLERLEQR